MLQLRILLNRKVQVDTMAKGYLVHHGILGMKWGKRNGPPYPLKESDKSAEEKKHYNVSAHEVRKNMDNMTDAELQKAINRINMQNQVKNLDPNIIEKGRRKVMDDMKKIIAISATSVAAYGAVKKISSWFE